MRYLEDIIHTPITKVLEEANAACSGLPDSISSFPAGDYLMQSLLLRMTGSQEQKLRAITWDMASNDDSYRYTFLRGVSKYGEYSSYDAKNQVFKDLLGQLTRLNVIPEAPTALDDMELPSIEARHRSIIHNSPVLVHTLFKNTVFEKWNERAFYTYTKNYKKTFTTAQVPIIVNRSVKLLQSTLKDQVYEPLYKQRNRIAHNVNSYQQNLPNLNELRESEEGARNYFDWFALLVIIDETFIHFYELYRRGLEENAWW